MKIIKNKGKKGLCVAYRCERPPHIKDRFCSKHSKRYQKEKNFLAYTFSSLKQNAKRRGKPFDLTLQEFKIFCKNTNYLGLKGRKSESASIDRIDSTKGYSLKNIQVLTLSQNSTKGDRDCPF